MFKIIMNNSFLLAPCNKNNNCNFIPITPKPSFKPNTSRKPKKFKGKIYINYLLLINLMQEPLCVTSPPASPGAWRQTATTGRPAGGSRGRPGAGDWRAAGSDDDDDDDNNSDNDDSDNNDCDNDDDGSDNDDNDGSDDNDDDDGSDNDNNDNDDDGSDNYDDDTNDDNDDLQDDRRQRGPGLRQPHLRHRPLQPGVQASQKTRTNKGVSTHEGQSRHQFMSHSFIDRFV